MRRYLLKFGVVASLFILSITVGVLVTQEGGHLPLTPDQIASATGVYEFAWAPDGKSIAYISAQNGHPEIWVVPAAGGASKRITSSDTTKTHLRWSKDGNWIAYIAVQSGGLGNIRMVSPNGEKTVTLTERPANHQDLAWSPDSRKLAFTIADGSRSRILVSDIENSTIKSLVEMSAKELQWSPNGQAIVFVSNPLLSNDDRQDNEDIFILSADGGTRRLLTPGTPRFRESAPFWAPDSRQIVYTSDRSGYSNVSILDTDSGAGRNVSPETVDQFAPKWSPDGKNIAYVRNENAQFNIWVIGADGGPAQRITDRDGVNGGLEVNDATPMGMYDWSPDGKRIAFTHSDPGRTSDLWVASLDQTRPIQLTNSMPADLRRESRFVWPDVTTYRSFDGLEVRSLVYRPGGIKPKTGYPALLAFRDTVDGQHALAWDPFIQFFVSDGYLVFAPNVRGSSGQGKDYRQLVFQHGGDYDIRDAFIGLDKLSSEGLIDTQRLGVFGAGTGGFLTTAALVKDETRFKAAVSLYGVVDTVTAASYPGMGAWSRYLIGSTPMANPVSFYERSIVNFVDKLRTPIIFFFTADDSSMGFQQLHEFAVQAEVKGKWFDYRIFENEPREWQYWRPNSLRQALEGMDALFEKHLLGRDREIRLSRNR